LALTQFRWQGGRRVYIAMNRFKVVKETARQFEEMWENRDSHLGTVDGFVAFHMLKGPEHEDHILYASHTVWQSFAHFNAWMTSEQFRASHANAGASQTRALYLGPPDFEGFEVIQEIDKGA
jgi:heme-degrading monooxygenase HmoA